jgi:hypothetical protein
MIIAVDQFGVYLRGELDKLRHKRDAAAFVEAAGQAGLLNDLGLTSDSENLSRQFSSQAAVDELVAGLPHELAKRVARCCGNDWRSNPDLYRQLTSSETQAG